LFTVVAGCLKSEEKEPTLGFPESSIITPSHPYGETSLTALLYAWSPNKWYFEE
jgi:hypothetical protein